MNWQSTHCSIIGVEAIDEYGHVNFLHYQRLADAGTLAIWMQANDGRPLEMRGGREFVAAEIHVVHRAEMREGEPAEVLSAIAGGDKKRFHLVHRVCGPTGDACVVEILGLSFDLKTRRVAPFVADVDSWFTKAALAAPADLTAFVRPGAIRRLSRSPGLEHTS